MELLEIQDLNVNSDGQDVDNIRVREVNMDDITEMQTSEDLTYLNNLSIYDDYLNDKIWESIISNTNDKCQNSPAENFPNKSLESTSEQDGLDLYFNYCDQQNANDENFSAGNESCEIRSMTNLKYFLEQFGEEITKDEYFQMQTSYNEFHLVNEVEEIPGSGVNVLNSTTSDCYSENFQSTLTVEEIPESGVNVLNSTTNDYYSENFQSTLTVEEISESGFGVVNSTTTECYSADFQSTLTDLRVEEISESGFGVVNSTTTDCYGEDFQSTLIQEYEKRMSSLVKLNRTVWNLSDLKTNLEKYPIKINFEFLPDESIEKKFEAKKLCGYCTATGFSNLAHHLRSKHMNHLWMITCDLCQEKKILNRCEKSLLRHYAVCHSDKRKNEDILKIIKWSEDQEREHNNMNNSFASLPYSHSENSTSTQNNVCSSSLPDCNEEVTEDQKHEHDNTNNSPSLSYSHSENSTSTQNNVCSSSLPDCNEEVTEDQEREHNNTNNSPSPSYSHSKNSTSTQNNVCSSSLPDCNKEVNNQLEFYNQEYPFLVRTLTVSLPKLKESQLPRKAAVELPKPRAFGSETNCTPYFKRNRNLGSKIKCLCCEMNPDSPNNNEERNISDCKSSFHSHQSKDNENIMVSQKSNMKSFICCLCSGTFFTKNTFIRHLKFHLEKKCFYCSKCNYRALGLSELRSHLKQHSNKKSNRNKLHETKFSVYALEINDNHKNFEKNNYPCVFCDKEFTRVSDFKRHLLIHFNH